MTKRKIYLLMRNLATYDDRQEIVGAFESKDDAQGMLDLWAIHSKGDLEIKSFDFFPAVKIPDGWRVSAPAPSFTVPGVVSEIGRAELP